VSLSLIARLAALERRQPPPEPDAGDTRPPFDHDAYRAAWEALVASAPDQAELVEEMVAQFAADAGLWSR
jgi:hypothetical protein